MEFNFSPNKSMCELYGYHTCADISSRTGLIGHLREDFGSGNEFWTTFWDYNTNLKTQQFREDLDMVVNTLREDVLKDLRSLTKWCYTHPEAKLDTEIESYGARADTEEYTFILRFIPIKGNYNCYVYCYFKEWFDSHTAKAAAGIRFIDPNYNELFRINDGEQVNMVSADDSCERCRCRYIDDYHLEFGSSVYHICELAERLSASGKRVEKIGG